MVRQGSDHLTLTDDEVTMLYAIFTCAERVDWACYEAFRLRILAEGAAQTAAYLTVDTPTSKPVGGSDTNVPNKLGVDS